MKQLAKVGPWIVLLILGGLLVAGPGLAYAAEQRATDGPVVELTPRLEGAAPTPEWGTAVTSTHIIPGFEVQANDSSVLNRTAYNRYSPTGQEGEASLRLPTGSLIKSIELQGCDTSATDQVVFILFSVTSNGSFTTLSSLGGTGTAATPGCGFFALALSTPVTVDAFNLAYYIAVRTGTTSATSFTALRAYYSLQVSPAPAVATFADVPTSSGQFKFVEALAAAGITGGCGGGNYCPNDPVTRGQMAVFLASALGLNWPF